MLSMAIEARLMEIRDVLNSDLIPHLFKLNGWNDTVYPTFEYGDLDDIDLEVFSKAVQRIKAVGLIPPTAENVNHITGVLGLPDKLEEGMEQTAINELLGAQTSRSGDGMSSGTGGLNGTGNSAASTDTSSINTENTA